MCFVCFRPTAVFLRQLTLNERSVDLIYRLVPATSIFHCYLSLFYSDLDRTTRTAQRAHYDMILEAILVYILNINVFFKTEFPAF